MFRWTQPWAWSARRAVQHVGADLGRPVRVQGLLGEQRGQRPGRHDLAHYPQGAGLREDVEDLVEEGVVGNLRGGRAASIAPAHDRLGRPAGSPPGAPVGLRGAVRTVEHLCVHELRQGHLDQDLLPAVRVEGARLGEVVRVRSEARVRAGRRQRQAVAVRHTLPA
ncbi:hypothetical protein SNARM312S_03030 [Streptomyces narbonensis]